MLDEIVSVDQTILDEYANNILDAVNEIEMEDVDGTKRNFSPRCTIL